jgi:hypothetical protein
MLQRIRDGLHGRKWLAWLALFPIAAIFVFWGGSSSLDFSGSTRQDAAVVNGEKIPANDATKAWSETQARWAQQFGTDIPTEQRARIQDNILDQLVLQKLLENRLDAQHYRVSEQRVLTEIPDNIKGKLQIRPVKWIDEVFEIALAARPTPRLATPPAEAEKPRRGGKRASKQVQAH